MKNSRTLLALACVLAAIGLTSCGQTYETTSIQVVTTAPTPGPTTAPQSSASAYWDFAGVGQQKQFWVIANNSNGKSEDITNRVQWSFKVSELDPDVDSQHPTGAMVVNGGMVQMTDGVCTWQCTPDDSGTAGWSDPAVKHTCGFVAPYNLTATYQGLSSTATITASSTSDCLPASFKSPTASATSTRGK